MKPISFHLFKKLSITVNVIFLLLAISNIIEPEVDVDELFIICILWICSYAMIVLFPTTYEDSKKNNKIE